MKEPEDRPRRELPALLVLFLLLAWVAAGLVAWRELDPPAALGSDAPAQLFSAGRARAVLERLAGDSAPRPLASPAAAASAARIAKELRGLGYEPELQESRAGQGGRVGARLTNVLARIAGSEGGKTLLVVAHYDSVAAGPGIGDDLSGCAALLEVAAAARAWGQPRADVVLLFDEGEEAGLLGAAAFAAEHPRMEQVALVVNVEARGTSGPSYLFETGERDGWLVEAYAKLAMRPQTSSLSREVYRRLPNDTDFTVFAARGLGGANLAFIEGLERYHTPLDSLEHLDDASLQHQGDNLAALLRAAWTADLAQPREAHSVWFDVLGRFVVLLSAFAVRATALLTLLAALVATLRAGAKGELGLAGALGAALGPFALAGASCGIAWLALRVLSSWTGVERLFLGQPVGGMLVVGGAVLLAFALLARAFAAEERGALGVWLASAILSVALAFAAPGAAFLPLIPATLLTLLGPLCSMHSREAHLRKALGLFLVLLCASTVWVGVLRGLVAAFSLARAELLALALAGAASFLAPALAAGSRPLRRVLGTLGAAALVTGVVLTGLRAPHDAAHPAPLNLDYVLDREQGKAWWLARPYGVPLPAPLGEAAAFERRKQKLVAPWSELGREAYVAEAPLLELAHPDFEELERTVFGDRLLVRGRVRPAPGAAETYLLVREASDAPLAGIVRAASEARPAGAERALARAPKPAAPLRRIQLLGEEVAAEAGSWIVLLEAGAEGREIELLLPRGAASELDLLARARGLPEVGQALLRSRDASGAVPISTGDGSWTLTRVRL